MSRFSVSEASLTDSPRRGGVTPSGQNVGHAFLRQHFAAPAPVSFDDLLLGESWIERRGGECARLCMSPPAYMSSEIRIYNSAVALRVSDAFSPPLSISLFLSPFINSLIETNGRTDGGCGRDLRGLRRPRPLTSLPPFSSPLPPKSGLRSQREEIFTRCGRSLFWAEPQFVHACKSIDVTGS